MRTINRLSLHGIGAAIALVVLPAVTTARAEEEPEQTATKPAWLAAEGPCQGMCTTTQPLKYTKKVETKSTTLEQCDIDTQTGQRKNVAAVTVPYYIKIRWDASGACRSKTLHDLYRCPSCSFENIPEGQEEYHREVKLEPIYAKTTESGESVGLPIPGGAPGGSVGGYKEGKQILGWRISKGPWKKIGAAKWSVDLCDCLVNQPPTGIHQNGGYGPGGPPPAPGGDSGGATTGSEYPPGLTDPVASWPTRCTNPACNGSDTITYTCAVTSSSSNAPSREVFDKWEFKGGVPVVKTKTITKTYTSKLTATWTVNSKGVHCYTRGDTNPSVQTPQGKPCPCSFESVPSGTATSESTRSYQGDEPVTEESTSPPYRVVDEVNQGPAALITKTSTVVVDYLLHLSPWSTPTTPAFTQTTDICSCGPLTPTTLVPVDPQDRPLTAEEVEQSYEEKEKNDEERKRREKEDGPRKEK